MKTIYLIRHGQTESNLTSVTGRSTDPLPELGRKQARLVAERLRETTFTHIVSSTYARALETGQAIAEVKNLEIELSPLFTEVKGPSEIEGTPHKDPTLLSVRQRRHELWGVKGEHISDEENFFDVNERVYQALTFLEQHSGNIIAVTTHGAFMRGIVQHILCGDQLTPALSTATYSRFFMNNTGISVIQFEEGKGWTLVCWNDTVHLDASTVSA